MLRPPATEPKAAMPILLLSVFVDMLGFGIIIPLLPFYAEYYGASAAEVTLLFATYSLTQFVASPLLGRLSDRIGRRPVILGCLIGNAVAYTWFGLADTLVALFLARALGGAMAGKLAVNQAYIADITDHAGRARGMGRIGAAFGLGFILGPAAGGLLSRVGPEAVNYALPAFAAAGLSVLAFCLAIFLLPESLAAGRRSGAGRRPPLTERLRRAFAFPGFARLIVLFFVVGFVFSQVEAVWPLWVERRFGWGPLEVGYTFSGIGILIVTLQGFAIGPLSQRFGEHRLLVAALAFLALGLALAPLTHGLVLYVVCVVLLCLGIGTSTPTMNSLASKSAAADAQGGALGIAQGVSALGRVAGPAWAGLVLETLGIDWPFMIGAAIVFLALVATARGVLARGVTATS